MGAWIVVSGWLAGAASADEPVVEAPAPLSTQTRFTPNPVAGWAVVELRGGVQEVAGSGNAMICAEVGVHRYVAFEACGSGAGFLYEGRTPAEMVHFRAEGSIPLWSRGRTGLWLQPGAGIAEVENGADQSGFLFGPARSSTQREGAGPEGSLGLKARVWPSERMYGTIELNGGAAHIPSAPVVLQGRGPWVPFVTTTIGVGF